MAYEKHTWTDNEVITAEKLNHIEEGIDSNIGTPPLIVHEILLDNSPTPARLDKTWGEIDNAFKNSNVTIVLDKTITTESNQFTGDVKSFNQIFASYYGPVTEGGDNTYNIIIYSPMLNSLIYYVATSANEYPHAMTLIGGMVDVAVVNVDFIGGANEIIIM